MSELDQAQALLAQLNDVTNTMAVNLQTEADNLNTVNTNIVNLLAAAQQSGDVPADFVTAMQTELTNLQNVAGSVTKNSQFAQSLAASSSNPVPVAPPPATPVVPPVTPADTTTGSSGSDTTTGSDAAPPVDGNDAAPPTDSTSTGAAASSDAPPAPSA